MKLLDSWLCLNCDEIFDFHSIVRNVSNPTCPKCTSEIIFPLTKYVASLYVRELDFHDDSQQPAILKDSSL